MTTELTALTLTALLQVIQYALMSIPANLELGTGKTMSARDRTRLGGSIEDQLSEKTARLYRALNNHFEGLILFTIAVTVITLTNQSTPITQAAAYTYLIARIAYIPAYYFGARPWRSVIWFVGFLATLTILVAALI